MTPTTRTFHTLLFAVLLGGGALPTHAQVPLDRGVVGTELGLRGLDGFKRVLLVGAHPDDEDTALLTALARGQGAETAYLSLTRGDGGQNLIGPQLGEGLGAIRTGELVAARELDGGLQFFTRAIDFGYSKTADETIEKWEEDAVLRDIVLVIRRFRPHVIVSIWQGNASDGHGHHQASGILTRRAFELAADPDRFPELAESAGVTAWATPKLYLLNRRSEEAHTVVETGNYDPVLGRSHLQIAMDSRSRHRSQDMGAEQPFGSRSSRLLFEAMHTREGERVHGDDATTQPIADDARREFFGAVDTTLAAPAAGLPREDEIREALARYRGHLLDTRRYFGAGQEENAVRSLASARMPLETAISFVAEAASRQVPGARVTGARAYLNDLLRRAAAVEETLLDMTGVITRVRVADDLIVPGESVEVTVEVWNGGRFAIADFATSLRVPEGWEVEARAPEVETRAPAEGLGGSSRGGGPAVPPGAVVQRAYTVTPPVDAPLSRLYYREEAGTDALYRWPDDAPSLWGRPTSPPPISAEVSVRFLEEVTPAWAGRAATPLRTPALSRVVAGEFVGVDKAVGEFTRPVLVVPAVSVAAEPGALVWPAGPDGVPPEAKEVTVRLDAWAESGVTGTLRLEAGAGWRVAPTEVAFDFDSPGRQRVVTFSVTPTAPAPGRHTFRAVATVERGAAGGAAAPRRYTEGFDLLDFPHIERIAFFEPAEIGVSVVPVRADDVRVGYIFGSGDDGLLALRQMGVEAREVTAGELRGDTLDDLDVLVLGIRVYETRPEIAQLNDRILAFAERGGTVISQYNKYEYPDGGYAPWAVSMSVDGERGAPRATDERSPVEFIHPDSPLIHGPNTLTLEDFEGWVQERGLYFLAEWDDAFVPQLRFRDPGEAWTEGSLVVAPYGEGLYIYTGLSLFRQLPAGVPGAYRLFANLVSLDRTAWDAWRENTR
ncbi:MAG: PIG-L family deacetylase [Longimicrobiales bacterium]|nr:PIG-L family deacetylase [Longimicrobiales bacterium]